MATVISFINNKGGVAKTTSAVSIGYAWAAMGKKVLFVDLDSQANLTTVVSKSDFLEEAWERTLQDAAVEGPDGVLPICDTDNSNIKYIPTDLDFSHFDETARMRPFGELILQELINKVRDDFDFVVMDCPPSLSQVTINAMYASDYLVLVTDAEGQSVKGTRMIIEAYKRLMTIPHHPHLSILGVLITKVENTKIGRGLVENMFDIYGSKVLTPVVPKSTKVVQATSMGMTIYDVEPAGKVAMAYKELAKELIVRIAEQQKDK